MAVLYALQGGLCCIISGWFHVNLTVTNCFSSGMCVMCHTLLCSGPGPQQPDTMTVTPLLRVCFAVIKRMFMDHQQCLVYIKDYLKNPAKESTSSQICTLLFLVSLQAFSLSAQSHLLSYHNSTCNLLALEWVQYGGEKPRIAFGSLMTRLTTWVGF